MHKSGTNGAVLRALKALCHKGLTGAQMKTMDQVYPEFMENAIQWMNETYASPLGYITRELGVTEADIQALREKFLE